MKNSSPINLNLGQTWLFHICFGCFFCFDLLWRWAESPVSPAEKKCYFGFDMAKIVNFKLSGDEFFMMSTSKIMVPLQSPCFLQYVVEFAIVLTTFVKRLPQWDRNWISSFNTFEWKQVRFLHVIELESLKHYIVSKK